MLILSRGHSEKIVIRVPKGENGEMEVITLVVLSYDRHYRQISLGFKAEKHVLINREEIDKKMEETNEDSN